MSLAKSRLDQSFEIRGLGVFPSRLRYMELATQRPLTARLLAFSVRNDGNFI
jgi:hypothetical protein